MGGAPLLGTQSNVTVRVNSQPIPTAQISIFVHEDNFAINSEPDLPQETGLEGFTILLEDAGGRYGISGQQIITDVFGNPLGSTYDNNGNLLNLGSGDLTTDINGELIIKHLAPGKYGVQAIPPAGSGWVQTGTIEGSKVIDAWVAADEPEFFTEFGPPGPHVFIGFIKRFRDSTSLTGDVTITGQIRSIHTSRPPVIGFFNGPKVPGCWIGLNESPDTGRGIIAKPCNDNSRFVIPNVKQGTYQLAIWDENLDYIFGLTDLTVNADGSCNNLSDCNLGNVGIFPWFNRLEQYVFEDTNENGLWDAGEVPLPEQATAIRWRDGTVYQEFPTDFSGVAPYDEVFPFFNWLVAEVNYSRLKATGATIVVDDGGKIDPGNPWSSDGALKPQPQSENGNQPFRTETGPVLTQAFQGFLGQTNVIQWGKKAYSFGENGGVSGIVYYATTRAEDDIRLAGAEVWEPGIPRLQLALYQDNYSGSDFDNSLKFGSDGIVDDIDADGQHTLADVDNYPFDSSSSPFPGPEDFDYNNNQRFDPGDAVQVTATDSWDDDVPTGCQGEVFIFNGTNPTDCFDGLRNFNQVRPGIFDGGYAFDSYVPGGMVSGNTEVSPIAIGTYIVGLGEHPVYEIIKPEDRNVDFGDTFVTPVIAINMPECTGDDHVVANEFSLFRLVDENGQQVSPPDAGETVKLCDRKIVQIKHGFNAAADFFFFTSVPPAAHVVGTILDDLSNEFDENSPSFGEKFAPPFLPISVKDYSGKEITRTYSDLWGRFSLLVPSNYTNNLPSSSGMSPNMLISCMNDPGPIKDTNGNLVDDPNFDRKYSQFCYTLQYLPGVTTYLDTPVVPVSAYTGPTQLPLSCGEPAKKPVIWSAQSSANVGPYVRRANSGSITITAAVRENGVANGFGKQKGKVKIGGVDQQVLFWSNRTIKVRVGNEGHLQVIKKTGQRSEKGIYVSVGGGATFVKPGGSIQAAINKASPGDLIIVPPGTYEEHVVMWKPVRLQGSGASTIIRASGFPTRKLVNWRSFTASLITNQRVSLLPEQEDFNTEQAPGILVAGKKSGRNKFSFHESRIDGFTITAGSISGGILVNGYAQDLEISNNRVINNYGIYGGGIRVGHPLFTEPFANARINIHHNYITENGATAGNGVGGGISLYSGSNNYQVAENHICGNYTQGSGAGIGHRGNNGKSSIKENKIIFNQSFNQSVAVSGGGIFIGGVPSEDGLSEGAGQLVSIEANLIQGNQAGAGNGGGVSTAFFSGIDAANKNFNRLNRLVMTNNMITNNMSGHGGGGISLKDTVRAILRNNTVVHNDSLATSGTSFSQGPNKSVPQPAGILTQAHTQGLQTAFANNSNISGSQKSKFGQYSLPIIKNSIIWRNRSYFFEIDNSQSPSSFGLVENSPLYWDLGVQGLSRQAATTIFNPVYSILTDATGFTPTNIDGSNLSPDDLFVVPYVNTANDGTIKMVELKTSIDAVPAFDEGGNYIDIHFGPLQLTGNYHLSPNSVAIDAGTNIPFVKTDFDGQRRFKGAGMDIGADESQ